MTEDDGKNELDCNTNLRQVDRERKLAKEMETRRHYQYPRRQESERGDLRRSYWNMCTRGGNKANGG